MEKCAVAMMLKCVMVVVGIAVMSASCSGRRDVTVGNGAGQVIPDTVESEMMAGLPELPEVPASLTDREAVAAFMLRHYWDNMDFTDTAKVDDDRFMDRLFAGYFPIFPYAAYDDAVMGADVLMSRAEVSVHVYGRVMDVVERFLSSPNSSMRNEELYYVFLQRMAKGRALDGVMRARIEARIGDVLKNRLGTQATDFCVVDNTGRRTSLYKEAAEGQCRLVIFYDPGCSHCHEIIGELQRSRELASAVASGNVKVMAVYADGDSDVWQHAKDSMPAEWLNCMSPSGEVADKELYSLPAMPVIYLIGSDNTVLLKDASLDELFFRLAE